MTPSSAPSSAPYGAVKRSYPGPLKGSPAEALMDSVEAIWHDQGDLALSVRRLTAASHTTSQAIYTYFGSMDNLLDSAFQRALTELDEATASMQQSSDWLRYALEYPARWQMVQLDRGPGPRTSDHLATVASRLARLTGYDPLQTAQLNGLIDAAIAGRLDPEIAAAASDRL